LSYLKVIAFALVATALSVRCHGRELITLKSGFSFEAISHQVCESSVVLTLPTGTVEFPASELSNIQVFEDPQPIAALRSSQPAVTSPDQILSTAANAQGLLPELVRSVAKIESNFDPKAVSPKGAIGLMQLMPATAAALGVNGMATSDNALGGAKYLRQLLLRYHGDAALALAAYNAGPEAVMRYGGVPPYPETRRYVVKVLQELARERTAEAHSSQRGTSNAPESK
jgi:hypothetical protein